MPKIKGIIRQCVVRFSQFCHKFFYFGFTVAFWDLFESQKKKIGLFKERINNKKHMVILAWLTRKFRDFVLGFSDNSMASAPNCSTCYVPPYIWTCWWDGIADAPDIIKACFNALQKNAKLYNVCLITKSNFRDFCTIPDYIMRKFESGIISKTHFSDILRMTLLSEHGGLWLDATVLVTNSVQQGNLSFFTIKREYGGESVSRQRWTGFCIGGEQNNILFNFVKGFFFEYWKMYDFLIDYFFIDYVIAIAYDFFPRIRKMMDNVPLNNPCVYAIQNNMCHRFDAGIYDAIVKNTTFNKLTWKERCIPVLPDSDLTFYGYILDKFGE